jgi:hypothetical protein
MKPSRQGVYDTALVDDSWHKRGRKTELNPASKKMER